MPRFRFQSLIMMATFVACANWLYIYSQFLVGSDGFPSHGNLLYIWYTNMKETPSFERTTSRTWFHFFLGRCFSPGVIGRIGLELPMFWAMCQKETSLLQKLWLLQRNISRSWGVSTAKMMSGSQHRWVFQSWHRPQRCSEKLCRKQTCMCKCRLQRTCGVTSKTSPGVLYYLLFTMDLNGKKFSLFFGSTKHPGFSKSTEIPTRKPGVLAVWVLQVGEQSPQKTESVAKAGVFGEERSRSKQMLFLGNEL